MREPVGVIAMTAIAAVAIAAACSAEGGALQAVVAKRAAVTATQRPETGRTSKTAQRRAEIERSWDEYIRERCVAPVSFAALPSQPPAC